MNHEETVATHRYHTISTGDRDDLPELFHEAASYLGQLRAANDLYRVHEVTYWSTDDEYNSAWGLTFKLYEPEARR